MMKILVTGFEPFNQDAINASMEVMNQLPDTIRNAKLIKRILPVTPDQAMHIIKTIVEEEHPDIVISLGQATSRKAITIERVGVNVDDFRIPDNANLQPRNQVIEANGPGGYLCELPVNDMVEAIRAQGVEADLSFHAGTFVCNHVCYATTHYLKQIGRGQKSVFIHLPALPIQVIETIPSMDLEDMVKGILAVLTFLEGNHHA